MANVIKTETVSTRYHIQIQRSDGSWRDCDDYGYISMTAAQEQAWYEHKHGAGRETNTRIIQRVTTITDTVVWG